MWGGGSGIAIGPWLRGLIPPPTSGLSAEARSAQAEASGGEGAERSEAGGGSHREQGLEETPP